MSQKELEAMARQTLNVYSGILFHNQEFESGNTEENTYEFGCPEFEELRSRYDLVRIGGKGSDFARAKRLLHYLAPRLTHGMITTLNATPCGFWNTALTSRSRASTV